MSRKFEIYDTNGSIRALAENLEYHSEWMDDEYVSVTVRSSEPVQFSVGDKLEYRGETFEINYDPNLIKRARRDSHGEAFVYENVRLYSQASRLKDVGFKDYVLNWNSESNVNVYSSQGTFQFFCGSVDDLADRIQANLDRHTPGLWKVFTPNENRTAQRHDAGSLWGDYYDGTESTGKTDVNIEADNLSCKDALGLSYSSFDLSFYVTSATVSGVSKIVIIIGGAPVSAAHNFRYGKGNGLGEIERTSDDTQRIVTKLFAYGSEKNLPMNYYANLGKQIRISILHKSTREIILGQPHLILWVDKEWSKSLESAFAPNYSVRLTDGSLTATVNVTHDHLNGYDNDHGPLVEDVDYMYFSLWSGDAGAQAFYDAVTAGETFTVTGVSINKMPEEFIYIPTSYNYPALLSINRLMLPGFPDMSLYAWVASNGGTNLNPTTGRATWRGHTAYFSKNARDPWIMSIKSDSLGVREGTLNFDGSAGDDEICPTIEGATDGSGRRLDEVAWAEQMDDNGFLGEDPKEGLLTFGFMPGGDSSFIDWLDNDGDVTISMKDGACVGREFKMKEAEKNANGDWKLTLNRCYDDSLGRYFPYREYGSNTLFQVIGSGNTHGISSGNHFVILGVSMPQGLVSAASVRLLEKALEQLDKKDHQTFTYIPKIDEIYMQHQDDAVKEGRDAATYGTVSLHDTLHAGMQMEIQDSDLNIHYMPFIDVLTIKEDGNNGIPTYDVVLRDEKELTMQQRIQSQIEGGTEAVINKVEDAYPSSRYLSKIQDDTAQGFIRLIKGLQVGERFVPGLMGEGGVFRKESDGTTYIEADNLYIRMKAYFDTVEIRKFLHTGGNRIATVAGAKCVRVEWLDSSNNVLVQEQSNLSRAVKFRCFFRANDGDNIVTNDFLVGDQAYCHVTRMQSETMEQASEGTGGSMLTTRHYWRLVIGTNVSDDGGRLTEDGEYWIDLSNYFYNGQPANMTWEAEGVTHNHLSHQAGSDIPMAQDDIVQLGHAYDTTRQGAIVEFVTGGDSPSYQIFQGIDEFSFVGKNYISLGYATGATNTHGAGHAYMDLYGDVFIGAKPDAVTGESPTYIKYVQEDPVTRQPKLKIKAEIELESPDPMYNTGNLNDFINAVTEGISGIQNQIDGVIETYYMEGTPSLSSRPATDWTRGMATEEERLLEYSKHIGDLYYDKESDIGYRFLYDTENETYGWFVISDDAIVEALRLAAQAQDTADNKRRVFVSQPTPPYDAGDLWVNATYPSNYTGDTDESQHKYYNDVLRCATPKPTRNQSGQIVDNDFDIGDWMLASKYGTELRNFIENTYGQDKIDLQSQIDRKAETWYQDEDPSLSTSTPHWDDDNANHVGDLWYNTSAAGGKVTYIFRERTSGGNTTYYWAEQAVPDEVFDAIDGKADIFAAKPTTYNANDLWIIEGTLPTEDMPSGCVAGDIVIASSMPSGTKSRTNNYVKGDWQKKDRYTDDSRLLNFLSNYNGTLQDYVKGQVDKKAETWVRSDDPSTRWTTADAKDEHVGDMWLNTSSYAVSGVSPMGTAIYTKNGSTYSWVEDNTIPNEVFDTFDKKKAIYVEYGAWVVDGFNFLEVSDLFIPSQNTTQGGKTYYADKVYRCTNASTPTFQEIAYTDDQRLTDFVNQILNGTGSASGNDATAANAIHAVNAALQKDNNPIVSGGLMLTTLIALKNNGVVWSGISGAYDTTLTSGGIAAWYGGGMKDYERLTDAQKNDGWDRQRWAKSIDRFDGSGYRASGNISWDANGVVTIKNLTSLYGSDNTDILNGVTELTNAFHFSTRGSGDNTVAYINPQLAFDHIDVSHISGYTLKDTDVLNKGESDARYLRVDFFNKLFQAYNSETTTDANKIAANDVTSTVNNLKLMVGTWTESYLSALGLNSSGGSSGVTLNEPLNGINNSGLSAPSTGTQTGTTLVFNGSKWTYSHSQGIVANYFSSIGYISAVGNITTTSGGFVKQGSSNDYVLLAGGGTKLLSEIGGGGSVTAVKVGTTTYNPTNGVVTLPDYLAKTGGTLTGVLTIDVDTIHPLVIRGQKNTNEDNQYTVISFRDRKDNIQVTDVGWFNEPQSRGNVAYIANLSSVGVISCDNSGAYYSNETNVFKKYTILHSGNIATFGFLPLSGGVLAANNNWLTPARLQLLRADATQYTDRACIGVTDGNLHIDCYPNRKIYLNYYSGSSTVYIGDGTTTKVYTVWHSGNLTNVSQLTNNSGYITSSALSSYLPLSAGSSKPLTDSLYVQIATANQQRVLFAKSGSEDVSYIDLQTSNGRYVNLGLLYGSGFGITNYRSAYLYSNDNGNVGGFCVNRSGVYFTDATSNFQKYTIYHSGNLPAYPTKASWNYDDVYLKLVGNGSLSGSLSITFNGIYPLTLKGSNNYNVIHLISGTNNSIVTDIGWFNENRGNLAYIANLSSVGVISCDNSGAYYSNETNVFKKYTIYHSGNLSPLTTTNYATTLGSVYHPYGGSTSIAFSTNGLTVDVGSSANKLHVGSASFTWNGGTYPTIYSQPASSSDNARYTMIVMPHLPFLENNKRGYTGATYGSIVRMESATTNQTYWDMGLATTDTFQIKRASTSMFAIKNTGCLYTTTTYSLGNVWKNAIAWGSDSYNKAVIGYLDSVIKGVVLGAHNAALNAWAPLHVSGSALYLCTDQTVHMYINNSGNVGIGTTSPSTSLYVVGRVTCEYDSTKSGSFRAIRGDYSTYYGINSSGFAMITTAQKDASSSTVRITMTPYTAQEQYIMFGMTSNFIMGTTISGSTSTYRDGAYIQIGGARIVWDNANTALKVVKSDGTSAANFYATGAVSALGANTSSGGGGGNYVTLGDPQTITGAKIFNATVQITQKLTVSNSIDVSGVIRSTNSSISCAHDITGGGNLSMNGTATIAGTATIGGYMTIGATVAVGTVSSQVIQTLNSRAIYIKTGTAPNFVDGTWSNTSDIRLKDIINNVGASVDQIANAPIFNYKWKSGGVSIMLGSSAQYWQKVFQHAVEIGPENYLYMDYSSVALASAVMVARKVQNHEDRILELERENEQLRNEIKQLKAA